MRFEKVSFEEFFKAQQKAFSANCSFDSVVNFAKNSGADLSNFTKEKFVSSVERIQSSPQFKREIKNIYDKIILPKRSTKFSAGYDFFFSCMSTTVPANSEILIPTGIRVKLDFDKVLMMYPRSGLGTKYGFVPCNLTGIIDSDYYDSDNEGHILMKMKNGDTSFMLETGTAFCQGIILNYFMVDDDSSEEVRNGGFGSTDKKNGENT